MAIQVPEIIDILKDYGIFPDEGKGVQLPEVGEIEENEQVYTTSIKEIEGEWETGIPDSRIDEWRREIESIIETGRQERIVYDPRPPECQERPKHYCAWYCPIHFFGRRCGIFIREECILRRSIDIARSVNWPGVQSTWNSVANQLWLSAFYYYFLHEQFHHKVESFGFRLLIATGSDRYRPYKAHVYRRSYLTPDCLEESLANAEKFRRLSETRYKQRLDKAILEGLKYYISATIPMQRPGYSQGVGFFPGKSFRDGLYRLQSQILDGSLTPKTPIEHWSVAPNMITSLKDITDKIYIILPIGARPIFPMTSISP